MRTVAVVDIAWPLDLAPYRVSFYLQPHVGGSESPITRTRKTYGLSAPRWVARMSFKGGYDGQPLAGQPEGYGPRLDAMIADLAGGLNIAVFHDYRRPHPVRPVITSSALQFAAAAVGATQVTVTGFAPYGPALSYGDYLGGDGRPHIIHGGAIVSGAGTIMADSTGTATFKIRPPLRSAIAAGTLVTWPVTGRFQLSGDDAGQNESTIGQLTDYTLDFVEELL
jgi:hypothetical protein